MVKIESKSKPDELAKVLTYYGLIQDTSQYEQKIICPFHGDVNPSMQLNLAEGRFYCFGCARTGGAFEFVKYANPELDDLKAFMEYRKILKSDKVRNIKIASANKRKRGDKKQFLDEAHDYYFGLRSVDWRYDTEEEVEECYRYMEDRGFDANILNKARAKVTYRNNYPIIFPMFDNGVFKGWVCRTNNKEVAKKRKYLYNKGFSRATTLVGNYSRTSTVVLVEGYMDYLKMRMFGMHKVAAVLGWKVTAEQVQKLKEQGVTHVISALDNDEYGEKGTKYLKRFFRVSRWRYEKGCKDAGDMTKESFERMKKRTKRMLNTD